MNHLFSLWKKASRIAPVSHLLNRVTVRGFSRATFDEDGASTLEKAKLALKEKRKIFRELQTGAPVQETLKPFMNPEENLLPLITRSDLKRWAKSLEKKGHHKIAVEIHMLLDNMADSMKLVSHGKPLDNSTAPKQTKSPNKFSSSKQYYAKHLPKQQPTHCLGLNAIADIASLISPSVVKLHIPAGCYGDRTSESHGTGFLIDKLGTILTCSDVVINPYRPNESSRDEVVVITKDGKKLMGEVEFYRKELEISIVKIKTDKKLSLPHLNLETPANPFVGQWVMCLGSHRTHGHSITKGIIRHLHRTSSDFGIKGAFNVYIQTDCPISEGSFGSPLLDLSGNVIGIVAKIERKGEGIGFALEIKTVCDILKRYYTLGKDGYVPNCGMIDNLDA